MLRKYVLFMGLLSCIQNTVFAGSSVVACYFNNWGIYRQGLGQFKVENIDPELCTHIFYAFEGVREDGIIVHVDEWADVNLNEIEDIIALKKSYPDLKVLVSIGGYGPLSAAFSQVMKETTARTNLINSSLAFIQKYGFDGLDIVWEFPTSLDKENFASFIQEIRCTFKDQNLLVTAAVSFTGNTYEDIYDVPVLSECKGNCGSMCGCRKVGLKCSAVCLNYSGVMELSELMEENEFEDELPTMSPILRPVIRQTFTFDTESDPEQQPGPSKKE